MNAVTQFALNRRRLLLGLAAASTTAAGVAVEAIAAPAENLELIRLGDALPELVNEYREAADAIPAILAKWSPRWPKAPEALVLGFGQWAQGEIECGLDGRALQYPTRFGDMRSRSIWTVPSLYAVIESCDGHIKRSRSARLRATWTHDRDCYAAVMRIAKRYEKACERVRVASGVSDAGARKAAARKALLANISDSLHEEARTMAGIVVQAQALEAADKHLHPADVFLAEREQKAHYGALLASSLMRIAGAAT